MRYAFFDIVYNSFECKYNSVMTEISQIQSIVNQGKRIKVLFLFSLKKPLIFSNQEKRGWIACKNSQHEPKCGSCSLQGFAIFEVKTKQRLSDSDICTILETKTTFQIHFVGISNPLTNSCSFKPLYTSPISKEESRQFCEDSKVNFVISVKTGGGGSNRIQRQGTHAMNDLETLISQVWVCSHSSRCIP